MKYAVGVRQLVVAGLLVAGVSIPPTAGAQISTRAVADRYMELSFNQRFEDLVELYAPDATYYDPTADVWDGPWSEGPVHGVDAIIDTERSWGLAETRFDIRADFTVGQYTLYRGTLNVRSEGYEEWGAVDFVTVLRVVDDHVAERLDLADYVDTFHLAEEFVSNGQSTREVAARYVRAYLDGDIDTQRELLAADARIQDPTSRVFGPGAGEPTVGAETILENRPSLYARLRSFDLEVDESFVSNHHAVFMGTTTYTLSNGQRYEQPAVFVIEVRDGQVTRQWDFVDYTVGPIAG